MKLMFVTLEVFNNGTLVSLVQPKNIDVIVVTFAVSNCGIVVSLVHSRSILCMFVACEVSYSGIDNRFLQLANM